MHNLLKRQLEKYFKSAIPTGEVWKNFFDSISNAYEQSDQRFNTLEHTLEIESEESVIEINNFRNAIDETAMVLEVNRYGVITFANKSFCDGVGFTENEIKKTNINNFLSYENNLLLKTATRKLLRGQIWKGEIYIKNNYEQKIWFHSTIIPIKNQKGKIVKYMSIMIDITSKKIFEDEIIKSANKYKNVVSSINDVLFQIDGNLELTFLNKAWTDLTKYSIQESLGINFKQYIHDDEKSKIEQLISTVLTSKADEFDVITKVKTKYGDFIWAKISGKLSKNSQGRIRGISGIISDVTEKKINEDLLNKSIAFQHAILNSAKQAIISTDENGIINTINASTIALFGNIENQILGKLKISELITIAHSKTAKKSSLEINSESLIAKAKELGSYEQEIIIYNKSENKTDVLLSVSTIRDDLQNNTGYLFILNDITDRKATENENKKLNKILEESPDFVIYYDLKLKPLYNNKSYKNLRFVHNKETAYPIHPEWVDLILNKKAIPYAMKHGSWKGETAIFSKEGIEVPVLQLIIIHKDENGTPAFISSVMRDITQRKENEKELLLSLKRNNDLINYSQISICTHDMLGNLITINPAGCEITGYQMEEMIGKPISDFIKEEYKSNFKTAYLNNFISDKTTQGILILRHKMGKDIYMLYKNYKVEEFGADPYIIGFAQDITDRIKIENELKQAKLVAEESLLAKENFLANMSHEIRTPMNGIVGLTNLLIKSQLNPKQLQYTESVKQSAQNLLVIINDILDFSKIKAGKLELVKRGFDLNSIIYNISQTFLYESLKKDIRFKCNTEDHIHPYLYGDHIRLNQVLENLLSNAVKFTEVGSVVLNVKKLEENKESIRLRFEIEDTGIGISDDKLNKIFQSFTQANSDTSRTHGGTGLGLSIAKDLTNLMGSEIKVKSTIHKGSLFTFDLNFEKIEFEKIGKSISIDQNYTNKLSGYKILLAEDNKVNQLFTVELINEWGAQIDIADNGKIAIDLMNINKYDIILMDIQMPEMSGIEATEYIRNKMPSPASKIPIIAMTANAMKGDEEKYLNVGMNAVVFKPFESHELYNKMKPFLEQKMMEESNVINIAINTTEEHETEALPSFETIHLEVLKMFSRGNISFIEKMISILNEAVPVMIDALNSGIEKGEPDTIRHNSHKLIPNMNMLGNKYLEEQMKQIEINALNPEKEKEIKSIYLNINPLLRTLTTELHQLNEFIKRNKLGNYLKQSA